MTISINEKMDIIGENQETKLKGKTSEIVDYKTSEVNKIMDDNSHGLEKEFVDNLIIEKIDSLPPMPKTIVDIENLNKSEEKEIDKLLEIIQGDPLIVANILKIVNSAMYGFSSQVKNIRQASILLGYNMTSNIAISTAINKLLNPDLSPYGIDINDFINISGAQSRIIEKWGEGKIRSIKNDLQIAAFLQEISKIVISMILIENGLKNDFQEKLTENGNIVETEKYFLHETSAIITAQIFSHWKFNQKIIDYIKYSDSPEDSPEELRAASYALNLAKIISPISNKKFSLEDMKKVIAIAEKGKFNIGSLEKMLTELNFI